MAELPVTVTELLAFLGNQPEVIDGSAESSPLPESPPNQESTEDLLARARQAGDYLEAVLRGEADDRIFIFHLP